MRRLAALCSLLAACSLVASLDDLRGGADADAGASNDAAPDACSDTTTDPHNCGACGHDCCGGTCAQSQCQPLTLASEQARPAWVIADDTHVYWLLDVVTSADAGPSKFPPPPTDVMRVRVDGSGLELFAHDRRIINDIQTDGTRIIWLEADFSASPFFRIAWLDKSAVADDAGDGGTVQYAAAVDPKASSAFMTGMLIDPPNAYWFANSSTECPGIGASCVYYAPTSSLASYTVVHTGFAPYAVSADSVDDHYIYPWSATGNLYRMDMSQPDASFPSDLLVPAGQVSVDAVDPSSIYWINTSAATVYTMPKATTADAAPAVFATLQNVPGGSLLVDNGDVYWSNADGIVTCPSSGCPGGPDKPRVVVAETGITYFALTSSCFYYANQATGTIKVVGR